METNCWFHIPRSGGNILPQPWIPCPWDQGCLCPCLFLPGWSCPVNEIASVNILSPKAQSDYSLMENKNRYGSFSPQSDSESLTRFWSRETHPQTQIQAWVCNRNHSAPGSTRFLSPRHETEAKNALREKSPLYSIDLVPKPALPSVKFSSSTNMRKWEAAEAFFAVHPHVYRARTAALLIWV